MDYSKKYKKYKKKYFNLLEFEKLLDIEGGTKKKKGKKGKKKTPKKKKSPKKASPKKASPKKASPKKLDESPLQRNKRLAKKVKYDRKAKVRQDLIDEIKLSDPSKAGKKSKWHSFKAMAYLTGTDIKIGDPELHNEPFLRSQSYGWRLGEPTARKKRQYINKIVSKFFDLKKIKMKTTNKDSIKDIKGLVAYKIICTYLIDMLMNINSVNALGKSGESETAKTVRRKRQNYKNLYRMVYIIRYSIVRWGFGDKVTKLGRQPLEIIKFDYEVLPHNTKLH